MHVKFSMVFTLVCLFLCSTASAQSSAKITGNGSNQVIQVEAAGGFNVVQVKVGNDVLTEGVDYKIKSNGSSKPEIELRNPPGFGKVVAVTGVGENDDPKLELSWGDKTDPDEVARAVFLLLLSIFIS